MKSLRAQLTVKRNYGNGHPPYTNESLKTLIKATMITNLQYKDITSGEYEA